VTNYVCDPQSLERFVQQVCVAVGSDDDIAAEVAHHLVRANLSGHDSHGVLRLSWYAEQIKKGDLQPNARPTIIREMGATAVMDAHHGFGQYTTYVGLEWAMNAARKYGLGAVALRHSTHIGRLGEYSERATAAGLIAMATVGSVSPGAGIVVPFGGRERLLGTNPWSIGVPASGHEPMIFDAATSTIAEGKLRVARSKHAEVPAGFIVDKEGHASTAPDDFYSGGALLPLGGAPSGHKGYGLSMASALIGALSSIDDDDANPAGSAFAQAKPDTQGRAGGVFVLVIDPAAFGDSNAYAAKNGAALNAANQVAPAPGFDAVLVPGEPEILSRAARGESGIPLPDTIWHELATVAENTGITLPEARQEA
jgi:hydroxycarboxylate dehydrogenase B